MKIENFAMKLDSILSKFKDYHLPICVLMFVIGTGLQWFHHLDMSFVAYTGTILGAITGHSFSPAGRPDKDDDVAPPPSTDSSSK
jgi:hypothetical protein